jgi:integrase
MDNATQNPNKLLKSKKYQGVYYKDTKIDRIYYIAYKNADNNYSKYKVGTKTSGITESYCYNLRNEEINKIKLGDNPKLSSKEVVIKFDEIANDYYNNMRLSQCSDTKNSNNKYLNHIKPVFGGLNIKNITPTMIHEYKIKKLQTHAPATVANQVSFISSIFNFAIKHSKKHKGDNPAFGIESTIFVDNIRERYLTIEEIYELLEVLKENIYNNKLHISKLLIFFVKFALSTGARATSIINIKRKDVDISTKTVQIFDTKNKSWYTAYLSSKLFDEEDYLYLSTLKSHHHIFYNNDRVLTHRIIAYHTRIIYNDLFNQGLKANDYKNRVCNHTLRHTFASHLAISGISLFEIKKLMNHKDINMTLRYMKLAEANKVSAVERIY